MIKRYSLMKKEDSPSVLTDIKENDAGSVGDVMPMCIFVICIAYVLISFAGCVKLINTKTMVSQISRQYILKMETEGYLKEADKNEMLDDLSLAGLENINLGKTDMNPVGYGCRVTLEIKGSTEGGYEISEFRTSTAKY